MTRKEAIKVLIDVQAQFQASLDEVDVDKDCKEAEEDNRGVVNALEMAIRALEQETTLDKIKADILTLQTYKLFEGEKDVYVERDEVMKIFERYTEGSEGNEDSD